MTLPLTVELPRPAAFVRHAGPHLIEATLIPLAVFYAALAVVGVWGALVASLVWTYSAIAFRLATRRRVPGILAIGALLMSARTGLALLTGSVFLYFLQPALGTAVVALAFLLSVVGGRPLAQHLARDFCPLPTTLLEHPFMRSFFVRITLLWGVVHLLKAGASVWLLNVQSVGAYVITSRALSLGATVAAVAMSIAYFTYVARSHEVQLRFAPRTIAPVLV
jgi:hypothetical protein